MSKQSLMFTISGPSCAGKTTLLSHLLAEHGDLFSLLVSDTTRPKRAGEDDTGEYRFINQNTYNTLKEENAYCQTIDFKGYSYGTMFSSLEKILLAGKVPIRVVEPSGVFNFKTVMEEYGGEVFSIYVEELPYTLLMRWLQRVHEDKSPEPDFKQYADRIFHAIIQESEWKEVNIRLWDFLYDQNQQDGTTLRYALSRVARGVIPLSKARRLSPVIIEKEKEED